ncbi:MAG: methyltransferase domain-containing protein, partial [Candidatus Latescibacterota bacterium]
MFRKQMTGLSPFLKTSLAFSLSLLAYTFIPSAPAQEQPPDASRTALSPVYAPLAEWITDRFDLSGKEGVGIDVGGGPGDLAVALSGRNPRLHWINADLNPVNIPLAVKRAEEAGVTGRVSAVAADVQALPFRDGYADIVVSRGSFWMWENLRQGLGEIHRVLKPGGAAFIGRGFSPNLPPEIARQVRDRQRGGGFEPSYDLGKTAAEFAALMRDLHITDFEIHIPRPEESEGIVYGVWLEFHKGERAAGGQSGNSSVSAAISVQDDSLPVMEPVEVSAHRTRDALAEPLVETVGLQTSVSGVARAEIAKQGAKSVVDALAYTPGAWTETRGRKVKQFVSFRGQAYPYPEYAISGSLFREFHELPFFFSANDIERIEVMRSSASLLTGISGLSGVINIIPRTYTGPETSWGAEYGSFGTSRVRLAHGNGNERFSYGVHLEAPHTEGPENRYAAESVSNSALTLHWLPRKGVSMEGGLFHMFGEHRLMQALPPAQERLQTTMERYDPIQATVAFLKTTVRHDSLASTEAILSWSNRDNDFVAQTDTSSLTT